MTPLPSDHHPRLMTFEFVGLCVVTFLAFCNVTVFYNLFTYLGSIGIAMEQRGVLIGAYSLTAMALYLVASPFLTADNAPRVMLAGMGAMAASGWGYFLVHTFGGLLALRIFNGAGQFCMNAGAMALLVSIIPPAQSGQAFGIFSVAILAGYGVVPTLMDLLAPLIPSPPHGYAAMTVSLLPAAWMVRQIGRRRGAEHSGPARAVLRDWGEIRGNITQLPVALLLLLNMDYFANWGSLFFLFKGFAQQQGLGNVGAFFSVQMALMIVIRLLGGRFFDTVDKVLLLGLSFVTIALGHLALDHLPGPGTVPLIGVLFGVGMGAGYPVINGLMFDLSPPRFRALNANLMMFALQAGLFFGPVLGGIFIARRGYHGYFWFSIGISAAGTALCGLLARQRRLHRVAEAR